MDIIKYIFGAILITLCLAACDSHSRKYATDNESKSDKKISTKFDRPLADMIEVVSVESGWLNGQRPIITIKFRNNSGNPISDFISIKYQFIENDEVFDEHSLYLHAGSNVDWSNGLCKTRTIESAYGYSYGGSQHKITAIVCFEDNSLIWKGKISQKNIYQ